MTVATKCGKDFREFYARCWGQETLIKPAWSLNLNQMWEEDNAWTREGQWGVKMRSRPVSGGLNSRQICSRTKGRGHLRSLQTPVAHLLGNCLLTLPTLPTGLPKSGHFPHSILDETVLGDSPILYRLLDWFSSYVRKGCSFKTPGNLHIILCAF